MIPPINLLIPNLFKYRSNSQTMQNSPDEKGSTFGLIIYIIMLVISIILTLKALDYFAADSMYYNQIFYKKDCDYVLPAGWSIKQNREHYYIIQKHDYWYGIQYISGPFNTDLFSAKISDPNVFLDSCRAKNCLKKYFEELDPTLNTTTP